MNDQLLDRVYIPVGTNGNQFVASIGQPGGPMQIAKVVAALGNPNDSGGVDEFCYLPNLARSRYDCWVRRRSMPERI